MRENIAEAIENAAINGGHVVKPKYLQNLITQVTDKIDGLDRRFCDVEGLIKEGVPLQQPQATSATVFDSSSTPGQWRYCYGGRFYSVPKGFELPMKLKLRAAFGLYGSMVIHLENLTRNCQVEVRRVSQRLRSKHIG